MNTPKNYKWTEQEQQRLNVLKQQTNNLNSIDDNIGCLNENLNNCISESEDILKRYCKTINNTNQNQRNLKVVREIPSLRSWDELVAEAEENFDESALITDILTKGDVKKVEQEISLLRGEFDAIHRLDKLDWAICGISGVLAALVDIFLINMPKHPGFLGGKASGGGPLSNWIREKIGKTYTPEQIKDLESKFWVPYDPPSSNGLSEKVAGLGPRTHRFQSLGHDPILGFIFGVKDILNGTFTSIDRNGKLITQAVQIKDSATKGMNLFEAIGRVFGHFKSDVGTKNSLPAPLMPLFQFLQFGQIGKHGYTIGEVSRMMYRSGYDFNHFIAMSIPTLLIEVFVRLLYFSKRMYEGNDFLDSIPIDFPFAKKKPKIQTMLFSAHLMATAANSGKVVIMKNPLAINYPQWIAFFRYLFPQLKWVLFEKDNERFKYVQTSIDKEWEQIYKGLSETWSLMSLEPAYLT